MFAFIHAGYFNHFMLLFTNAVPLFSGVPFGLPCFGHDFLPLFPHSLRRAITFPVASRLIVPGAVVRRLLRARAILKSAMALPHFTSVDGFMASVCVCVCVCEWRRAEPPPA